MEGLEILQKEFYTTKLFTEQQMITTIIFDWGGVLIDNPADELVNFFAKELNTTPSLLKPHLEKQLAKFQIGDVSESEFWIFICIKLKLNPPTGTSLWKEAVKSLFKEKSKIFKLVKDLKSNGYQIGFLSNTEKPTQEHFYEMGYDNLFEHPTFSCEVGIAKPNSKIFQITLDNLNAKPQKTIFIDDKQEFTIAATKLGINTITFTSPLQVITELKNLGIKTHQN